MRRALYFLIALFACSTSGCQTLGKPISETDVDQALIVHPPPSTPPPEASSGEPRPGFEQESPKSQTP